MPGYYYNGALCINSCTNYDPNTLKCLDTPTVCNDEFALPPLCQTCRKGFVKSTSLNKCIKCNN